MNGFRTPAGLASAEVSDQLTEALARTAEREALATAIARRAAAEARFERTQAAAERASELGREALGRLDRVERDLADARATAPRQMVEALLSGAEPGVSPVQRYEAELADAREQRDQAREAGAALRQEVEDARVALDRARDHVRRCAAAVVAVSTAVIAVIERAEQAQQAMIETGAELRALVRAGVLTYRTPAPGGWITDEGEFERRARRAVQRLDTAASGWLGVAREGSGTASWARWLDALMVDPDAPAP